MHSDDPNAAAVAPDPARPLLPVKIAKGPVEGSMGFERRRNRRNTSVPAVVTAAAPPDAPKPHISSKGVPDQARVPSAQPGGTATATGGAPRRQNGHGDLQDPDFDRRYDKWAVRHAPPPPAQQIPVPIFSQLLYPYAMQAAATRVHPPSVHMAAPQMQTGGVGAQYAGLQGHGPVGGLVFQQGIAGLEYGAEGAYAMRSGEEFAVGIGRDGLAVPMAAPVVRKPSPAYGLDSTVDFPPLP